MIKFGFDYSRSGRQGRHPLCVLNFAMVRLWTTPAVDAANPIANVSGWRDWSRPAVTHSSRSLNDPSNKQRTDTSGKDKWWTSDHDEVSPPWHAETGGWYVVSDGRSAARSSNDSWYVVNENTIRPWPNRNQDAAEDSFAESPPATPPPLPPPPPVTRAQLEEWIGKEEVRLAIQASR